MLTTALFTIVKTRKQPKSPLPECEVAQLCLTLCDPMDYSLPRSSVHGIFQARILKWVAMPSSRASSQPRDWTHVSLCLLHCKAGSLPLVPPGKCWLRICYAPGNIPRVLHKWCHYRLTKALQQTPLLPTKPPIPFFTADWALASFGCLPLFRVTQGKLYPSRSKSIIVSPFLLEWLVSA